MRNSMSKQFTILQKPIVAKFVKVQDTPSSSLKFKEDITFYESSTFKNCFMHFVSIKYIYIYKSIENQLGKRTLYKQPFLYRSYSASDQVGAYSKATLQMLLTYFEIKLH
uniref:Uncharacterized protein n=1 Tax=Schistocephalus solidus TaxID=70667 RepID=A0A0X3NXQ0_SCHSO